MNLDWSESYSLDVPEIDVQHQRFLTLVKKLNQEENCGKLKLLIEEIYRYAVFHFSSEEELMNIYAYPEAEQQKVDHQELLLNLSEYLDRISDCNFDKEKFIRFLFKWFSDHTTLEDKKLGVFINTVRSL